MTYYIAPSFLNKLAVHITKNYLSLPQIKVPLILGIHGRKGEGKTFQCERVFEQMGVEVVHISGGELESPDAGDPARLIRLRYREAAELVRVRGRMAVLMINDLDAGAGRFDRMTQYTVNTQLVNNTLMNIADNPTNVQLPGSYDDKPLPRIPIVATGNDFATLYAPLIRDGRMQKFYWEPSEEDRLGILGGMFADDGLSHTDLQTLLSAFPGQAIDFFSAIRAQIYDEQISQFIHAVGLENIAANVVNTLTPPQFNQPSFQLDRLLTVGQRLLSEQERVRTMGLVSEYNQAVTPAHLYSLRAHPETARPKVSPALLTVPETNPLSPYPQSNSSQESNSSPWKRARVARLQKADARLADRDESRQSAESMVEQTGLRSGYGRDRTQPNNAHPNRNSASRQTAIQKARDILSTGHKLGIEHVDQRRFRTNAWQSYRTLESANSDRCESALQQCFEQFPDHYIRLIAISPSSNQRLSEFIVQRPHKQMVQS